MKKVLNGKLQAALVVMVFFITSCAPQLKLVSSWSKKDVTVKKSPAVVVMILGKTNPENSKAVEKNLVSRLKKEGFKAVPASDLIKPGTKLDSAQLVNILQENKIDMLLTNAVVKVTENQRFIPGALPGNESGAVPAGVTTPLYVGYSYYGYYDYYNTSNVKEAPATPGTTVTDVEVVIESNLYQVANPVLIWHGQSKSYSRDPTKKLLDTFSKAVVGDIKKRNLLLK